LEKLTLILNEEIGHTTVRCCSGSGKATLTPRGLKIQPARF